MKKTALLLLILFTLTTTAVQAQAPDPANTTELTAFLDPIVMEGMNLEGLHIPGAVVVIVKDGRILFNEGYGNTSLDGGQPIDPDTTSFRVASLTKLFTATAVMQLAEQGQLDLNTDINQYLPFPIPATFPEPITLHHLLTHSSGLDDRQIGDAALTPESVTPLSDYLANQLPDRLYPPGQRIAYSNHGYALAGYIVETVSGKPFAEYIASEILQPLNMTHSTLNQPPPANINLATGYAYNPSGLPLAQAPDFSNVAPADALIASGTDMAQFMIAHLERDSSPILSASSQAQMDQTQFSHHPLLNGRTYGLLEWETNGRTLLTHTGGQLGFLSYIALYPEENLGIFIAQNGRFGSLRFDIFQQFMDHYYPAPDTPRPAIDPSPIDPSLQVGQYRSVENYFPNTFEKIAALFGLVDELTISLDNNDNLTINQNTRLLPLDANLFQLENDPSRAFFQTVNPSESTPALLFIDDIAYQKLAWYESGELNLILLILSVVILMSAVFILPLAALKRRRNNLAAPQNHAHNLAFLSGLLALTFTLGLLLTIDALSNQLDYGVPPFFLLLLALPILNAIFALPLIWFTTQNWLNKTGPILGRSYLSLINLATILYILILNHWNLLGYHF